MSVRARSRASSVGRPVAVLAALISLGMLTQPIAAQAAEYATWEEVEEARQSETATKALIDRIRGQIDTLRAEAQAAEEEAERAGYAYEAADQAFQEAAAAAARLASDLAGAQTAAEQSYRQAGQVAVQFTRTGGPDVTAALIASDSAGDLLSRLNTVDRVGKIADAAYTAAAQNRNTVDALAAQADVAEQELADRRAEAEALLIEAQLATDAAQAALQEQVGQEAALNAQLAVLTENRIATERDFAAGEAARKAEAEARARAEAEARARAEEEARARAIAGSGGAQSSAGWANPTSGWISSPYGYRLHPVYKVWRLHTGTDVAGGCGAAIYAASGGTVSYAGRYGSYGNFILIDHGGGVQTGYAHIADGGLFVGPGQQVSAGQAIARQGTTGASTGCHLHFEVRLGGAATDPVPYLRDRGAGVGG